MFEIGLNSFMHMRIVNKYSQFEGNSSILNTCDEGTSQPEYQIRMDRSMQTTNVLGYSKIALHLNNPDIDDVWLEGFEAATSMQDESDNPYQADQAESEYWAQGWWAGFYGEQPLFDTNHAANDCHDETPQKHNIVWHCIQSTLHAMEKVVAASLASLVIYEILFNVS